MAASEETRVEVRTDADIVTARMHGRELAVQLGFPSGPATLVATAISELARNILLYALRGEITLTPLRASSRRGLPGVRLLVDEFSIDTQPGGGTTVVVKKWTD